jgi:putative transposase
MSVYTLEERKKAVELYLKWGRNSAAVRRELGYPSKKALKLWVKEYESSGTLHEKYRPRKPKYPE